MRSACQGNLRLQSIRRLTIPLRTASGIVRPANFIALRFWSLGLTISFFGKQASAAHCQNRKFRGFDWSGIARKKSEFLWCCWQRKRKWVAWRQSGLHKKYASVGWHNVPSGFSAQIFPPDHSTERCLFFLYIAHKPYRSAQKSSAHAALWLPI